MILLTRLSSYIVTSGLQIILIFDQTTLNDPFRKDFIVYSFPAHLLIRALDSSLAPPERSFKRNARDQSTNLLFFISFYKLMLSQPA